MRTHLTPLLERGDPDSLWMRTRCTATYRELAERIDEQTGTLAACGIGPRHAVALFPAHTPTMLWSVFAIWRLGAQAVLVEPGLDEADIVRLSGASTRLSFAWPGSWFRAGAEVLVRALPSRAQRTSDCLVLLSEDGRRTGWDEHDLWREVCWRARLPGAPRRGQPVPAETAMTVRGFVGTALVGTYAGACLDVPANDRMIPARELSTSIGA